MTDYAPKAITVDGTIPTVASAAAGDKLTSPGERRFLWVKNGSGSPITLTITPSGTTGYNVANPAKVFTIAAGAERDILILAAYGNPDDGGKVALTWSSTTTVTHSYKRA